MSNNGVRALPQHFTFVMLNGEELPFMQYREGDEVYECISIFQLPPFLGAGVLTVTSPEYLKRAWYYKNWYFCLSDTGRSFAICDQRCTDPYPFDNDDQLE